MCIVTHGCRRTQTSARGARYRSRPRYLLFSVLLFLLGGESPTMFVLTLCVFLLYLYSLIMLHVKCLFIVSITCYVLTYVYHTRIHCCFVCVYSCYTCLLMCWYTCMSAFGRTLEAPIPKTSGLVKKISPFSKRKNPL